MKTCFLVVILVCFMNYVTSKVNLGEVVQLCNANDPKLNECILRAANQLIPILAKGIADHDIPPLDPLVISRMNIAEEMGPLNLQLSLYDTIQKGLASLYFDSVRVDLGKGRFEFNGTIPHYDVQGKYTGRGKMMVFPIAASGKANLTFDNTKIFVVLDVDSVSFDHDYHLRIKKFKVSYKYDKVNIMLSNLFGDNKRLAEAAQKFLNAHSKELLADIQEPLAGNYSKIFTTILQKLFFQVPVKDMFLAL